MAINKVVYGNNTLIDLTNDTVEASNLLEGETAHDRSGTPVTGTAKQGHIIKDGDGTAMPTQPNLQFADANVSNDGTGGATVIKNFVDINWEEWQEVDDNDDTYYRVTDAPLVDGNVEVDLMKKLWENPAPTASFVAQNITLDSADYDFLVVFYMYAISIPNVLSVIAPKGNNIYLTSATSQTSGAAALDRVITYVSDTSLSVDNGYYCIGSNARTLNNTSNIPIAIYGIKQKVTISLSAIISNVSTSASKCMLSDGETSVEDKLADTGWLTSDALQYRKIGSCVWIKGTISASTGGVWSGITTLPVGFRPLLDVQISLYSDETRYANMNIGSTGYVEAKTNVGLPYSVSFLVD